MLNLKHKDMAFIYALLTIILTIMSKEQKNLSIIVKFILSIIIGYWLFIKYNIYFNNTKYEFINIAQYSDKKLIESFQNNTAPVVLFFSFLSWFFFYVFLKKGFDLFLEKIIKLILKKIDYKSKLIKMVKIIHFKILRKTIRNDFYIKKLEVKKIHRKPISYYQVKNSILNLLILTLNIIVSAMVLNLYIDTIYYLAIGFYVLFLIYWFAVSTQYYFLFDFTEKITTHEYDLYKKQNK